MPLSIRRLRWTDPHLADIAMPRGVLRLTRSLASGLCRSAQDPEGVFWGVGDRGPNIKPGDAAERYGAVHLAALAEVDGAKIMPLLSAGPALARFRRQGDTIEVEAIHDLTAPDGRAIGGLPVPAGPHAEFEPVYDIAGAPLGTDPDGADSEAIAANSDGSFWIADEYGPSLLRVDRQGRVLLRWIPRGMGASFAAARCPVVEALPPLAAARKLNRGIEALALSPGGAELLIAFQSPLAHPDRHAHDNSTHVRIWRLDATDGTLLAENIYPLDEPESFRRDCALGAVTRGDIKVSEFAALANGRLLVLERVTLTTKIYCVMPNEQSRAPATLADPVTRPTLEQMSRQAIEGQGIIILEKSLILSTDDYPEICGDLEGMVLLSPTELLLSSDSDFGTEGAETQFWLVEFADGRLGS